MKSIKQLFDNIRDGNHEHGVEQLYNLHYNKMYALAFAIVKNRQQAEDIVHNTVLKLLRVEPVLFPTAGESTWLYNVIHNEAITYLQSENRHVHQQIDGIFIEDKNIEDYVDMDVYNSMLKGLNDTQKEVVTLKVLGGYTHREIGEIMDKPTSTIQWLYATAIKQLRAALAGFISSFVLLLGGLIASIVLHVRNANAQIILPGENNPNPGDGPHMSGGVGGSLIQIIPSVENDKYRYIILGIILAMVLIIGIFALVWRKNKKNLEKISKSPTK